MPTRVSPVNKSLPDLESSETANGMMIVEEISMIELKVRAVVIGDKV
jgi:hypothetical protein